MLIPSTYDEMTCAAFGFAGHRGNLTTVVFGAGGLPDEALREVAARSGLETAFVLPARTPASDFRLRFFVPTGEMTMCVHGTIGAIAALASHSSTMPTSLRVETPLGSLPVDWVRDHGRVFVTVGQRAPEFRTPLADGSPIADALGLERAELDSALPIQAVSVARAKLIVPVRTAQSLDRIAPDFEALWTLCEQLDVTGFYPVTTSPRAADRDIDARQFPLRAGFPEDPATGNAAAALAAFLTQHSSRGSCDGVYRFRIGQGDAMGIPCMIEADALVEHGQITATRVGGQGLRCSPPGPPG